MPLDIQVLEAQLNVASVEVRFAPMTSDDSAIVGQGLAAYFRELDESRAGFDRVTAYTSEAAKQLADSDDFLSDSERATTRRLIELFRHWAPRFAELRAHETDRMVLAFPRAFRPYNDALLRLVRSLIDSANALAARLADELKEDVEADAWVAHNPPPPPYSKEEYIPLKDA